MPYNVSTYSIVFFLWVIIINCVLSFNDRTYLPNESTLTSSKAASTSSKTQNGTGLDFKIANNKLIAVKVFSPPDNKEIVVNFLPGGLATISIPVSQILLGSVSFKSAVPPLNNSLKVVVKLSLIILKVLTNSFSITLSISSIISSKVFSALVKSSL